ncbi:hypothetical protein MPS_5156 [Mycobacterium pseudoshottsii JCM 15466]|nr:hypothetical protein MPS_5156 [Mycobacterium pseudoshottsii JCM 15466]
MLTDDIGSAIAPVLLNGCATRFDYRRSTLPADSARDRQRIPRTDGGVSIGPDHDPPGP